MFREMLPRLGLQVLIGVPQWPKFRSRGACGERVAAQHIDVFRDQRRQAMHVLVCNVVAAVAEPGQCGFQVAGVPQDDGVQNQAKGAELVFLAFPVGLPYLAPPPVEDESGQGMPGFLALPGSW